MPLKSTTRMFFFLRIKRSTGSIFKLAFRSQIFPGDQAGAVPSSPRQSGAGPLSEAPFSYYWVFAGRVEILYESWDAHNHSSRGKKKGDVLSGKWGTAREFIRREPRQKEADPGRGRVVSAACFLAEQYLTEYLLIGTKSKARSCRSLN